MYKFVGKTLNESLEILKNENTNYEIVEYNNDRPFKCDNKIVIREKVVDGILQLVVTNVLIEI